MKTVKHGEDGVNFGHQFHGREHHFLVLREALEYLEGGDALDDTGELNAYNKHLGRIHAAAEVLSKNADPQGRIVLGKATFEVRPAAA